MQLKIDLLPTLENRGISGQFSLVILTSRFEAARGLFWDGPCNFESWSEDEGDTGAGIPSPNFHATPKGGSLATTYDLTCNRPHTRLQWNRVSNG
ncbi:hypothetical protein AVEN_201041-1 [Araneus ventricosus]|uniref:Uncharacterized protein n=1 Tax=Araneus ventricosus TaxID=182803 RepID=A0A4Y2NW10_ARAVE|nr:hypothetical protein AVEN_201041-1 [Araneus ventricosus]